MENGNIVIALNLTQVVIVHRKSSPAKGGAARDPNPQPRKKMGETLPVTSILLADQEKAAPNCQETRRPTRAAAG